MSDNTLEALPIGLGAVNERSLKRLLLIFDKVCLPDPSEQEYLLPPYSISHDGTKLQYPNASDPLYNGERFKRIESDILNKYDYARKRNSITCLNLRHSGFYGKYALPLKLTRLADVTNPVILELLSPLCEKTQTQNIVGAPRADFIGVPQKNRQIQFINLSFNIPDTDCNLEEYVSMIGRINRLLIVSEYFNLVPVFTEDAAFEFFRRKIDLARKNIDVGVNNAYERVYKSKLSAIQYLLFRTSQCILPDALLDGMPIREFLIARDNTFHELYKMRQKVLRLFRQITDLQYTETFARDVDSFLNKEVIPHVNEYNNKFAEHFLAFVKYASKFQWPLITAYISVAQSLGLADIALLSGASTVLGDLIYNLIDHMTFKDRNKFRNTFSYFINMKETCEEYNSFREMCKS